MRRAVDATEYPVSEPSWFASGIWRDVSRTKGGLRALQSVPGMDVAEIPSRGADMNHRDLRIVAAAEARRSLTEGDIQSEIAYQNDINTLLARLEQRQMPCGASPGRTGPPHSIERRSPHGTPRRCGSGGRGLGDRGAELLAQRK